MVEKGIMPHYKFSLTMIFLLLTGCTSQPVISEATAVNTQEPATSTPGQSNAWEPVWADEFDQPDGSPPDPTKWNHQEGGNGWGNGELQQYTSDIENAFIQNGMLVIQAVKEYSLGRDYTSARLTTQFRGDWTYGRYEIRAKLPTTQGIWPAFWLLPSRAKYGSGAAGGEIDIMELIGSAPGTSYGTLHFGNPAERSSGEFNLPEGETFSDDFHVFAVEWEPDEIRWYVDDVLFHSEREWFTTARKDAVYPAPFDQDFYFIVNVAVGGHWPGDPDETSVFPQMLYVDYVRVYQRPK
jgi:beta-glucanase (GH16 family)